MAYFGLKTDFSTAPMAYLSQKIQKWFDAKRHLRYIRLCSKN